MNLVYKKIEEKDKDQLFKLIETVLGGLEDKEYFIPYEQWEYDSMFDEKNYDISSVIQLPGLGSDTREHYSPRNGTNHCLRFGSHRFRKKRHLHG